MSQLAIGSSSNDDDGRTKAYSEPATVYSPDFCSGSSPESSAPSKVSSKLSTVEINGQFFDQTSTLAFLHQAWSELFSQTSNPSFLSDDLSPSADTQPLTTASDKPFPEFEPHTPLSLPEASETKRLLELYFNLCMATYCFLDNSQVEAWLDILHRNAQHRLPLWQEIGRTKASIVLAVLAIAITHHEHPKNSSLAQGETAILLRSDELFCVATKLVDTEVGCPTLESAQARLVQVLYLLTTSRFNRAWYVFGTALQIVSALGLLHRSNRGKRGAKREDCMRSQCELRTFWTAYILDNYLGVIFGRPRHFHDGDVDQDLPDPISTDGCITSSCVDDCHADALIFHAR